MPQTLQYWTRCGFQLRAEHSNLGFAAITSQQRAMKRQTFELLILGSSSATPTSERNPSGQLLNICERYFMIDCGEGTQIQLRRFRSKLQSIGHICISHMHGDHFFGVPGLLSSMHLLGRQKQLRIYCPEELK